MKIIFFANERGESPVIRWLDSLSDNAQAIGHQTIAMLSDLGHSLRRPHADTLRDKIKELRWKADNNQFRILYFSHGNTAVVLVCGFKKKTRKIPDKEIDKAIGRMKLYLSDSKTYTYDHNLY